MIRIAFKKSEKSETLERFNMNEAYLKNLDERRREFEEAFFRKDSTVAYRILRMLEINLSPKVDNSEVEKRLDWVEKELDFVYMKDTAGKPVRYNYGREVKVMKVLREIYAMLLESMDRKGILTFKSDDDFGNSILKQ